MSLNHTFSFLFSYCFRSILFMVYMGIAYLSFAQTHSIIQKSASTKNKAPSHFKFSADFFHAVTAKGEKQLRLSGHAHVINGKTSIQADSISLFGNNYDSLLAKKNIHIVDEQNKIDISSSQLSYNRQSEISTLTGYCILQDSKDNMVVTSYYVKNQTKNSTFVAEFNVSMVKQDKQGNMLAKAEIAYYDQNTNILSLSGNPVVYWKNNVYRSEHINVNTKTDTITMLGSVNGVVQDDSSKSSQPKSS